MTTTDPATPELTAEETRDRRVDQAHAALVEGTPLTLKISGGARDVVPSSLARLFPVISREELAELVADIEANGLREPICLTGEQRGGFRGFKGRHVEVLDGRGRYAALWVLDTNLGLGRHYRMFEGTADQAVSLVVSANILRRHLTVVQRALLVRRFFLADAEAEAKERKGGRRKAGETDGPVSIGSAADVAAARAGGLISGRSVRDIELVERAPKTYAKAMAGDYSSVSEALRKAENELDVPPTKRKSTTRSASGGGSKSTSTFGELAMAVEVNLKAMIEAMSKPRAVKTSPAKQRERIARLRALLDRWEVLLDASTGGGQ